MQTDTLNLTQLQQHLCPHFIADPTSIQVVQTVDSTNEALLQQAKAGQQQAVLLAEYQTQGRGQRGRVWEGKPGQLIMMSVLHHFNAQKTQLHGLSLLVGLAVADALTELGWTGIQVKWPNDIWLYEKKLGGILVETLIQKQEIATVIGLGLNVYSVPEAATIQQPVAALIEHLPKHVETLDRTSIVIAILQKLYGYIAHFTENQFLPFLEKWQQFDGLQNKQIKLMQNNQTLEGVAMGIDMSGALLVDINGELNRFFAGEVLGVRPV